ncbi:MAG: hypothetical protein GAK28_00620 [Luteibacter sp.]|uniref:hypothetical protein n=1 Tax=Luteibacter sp. TaxID=1886636 RepID=UPI0013853EAC|nr:hypothetical protein [Luteibacter sp.]KAF1008988.1 MAG: hypothetical protein GAK28_00620 [Luteibacter sp.]
MATTLDNFVRSVLAVDATAADTQLVLAKAAAPLRDPPAATTAAPGVLVLQDAPAAPAKIEIVRYTGRNIVGNQVTLTGVTRAQEGTTAQSWTAGTPTLQGITAGLLAGKMDIGDTAAAAAKLATPRTFSLTGVVNASGVPFDGTLDLTLNTTIADNALTFAMVSGLQAALNGKLSTDGGTLSGGLTVNGALTANSLATTSGPVSIDAASGSRNVRALNGGKMVWQQAFGDTTADLARYDDSGVFVANAMSVNRATGVVTMEKRPLFGTATPWDTGNLTPVKVGVSTTSPGTILQSPLPPSIAVIDTSGNTRNVALQVSNAANNSASAVIGFIREGVFGAYFGLDTDNQWKVGGWSMGQKAYVVHHDGNRCLVFVQGSDPGGDPKIKDGDLWVW